MPVKLKHILDLNFPKPEFRVQVEQVKNILIK